MRFFVDILDFEVRTDVRFGERRLVELAPPGADTALAPYTWIDHHGDRVGGFARVVLECEDVAAAYEVLSRRGVVFQLRPGEAAGVDYAEFLDPFGNVFVLGPAA